MIVKDAKMTLLHCANGVEQVDAVNTTQKNVLYLQYHLVQHHWHNAANSFFASLTTISISAIYLSQTNRSIDLCPLLSFTYNYCKAITSSRYFLARSRQSFSTSFIVTNTNAMMYKMHISPYYKEVSFSKTLEDVSETVKETKMRVMR